MELTEEQIDLCDKINNTDKDSHRYRYLICAKVSTSENWGKE